MHTHLELAPGFLFHCEIRTSQAPRQKHCSSLRQTNHCPLIGNSRLRQSNDSLQMSYSPLLGSSASFRHCCFLQKSSPPKCAWQLSWKPVACYSDRGARHTFGVFPRYSSIKTATCLRDCSPYRHSSWQIAVASTGRSIAITEASSFTSAVTSSAHF